jgi:dolichol-phosphate mannosyltransferase
MRLPAFRGVHRFLGPLLLREGCRLVQVPVGHRPRPHGRSHYNLWNRSLQVVVDLIGVAWLLRRPLRYRVLRAWDADEIEGGAFVGAAVGIASPGAED